MMSANSVPDLEVACAAQAKVSFQDDMDGMQLGGAKEEKRMSLEHTLASLLATPARRNDEAVVSGKRTKKKKGRVETPQGSDSSARDSFSPGASAAGDLQDCALPLTFDAEDQMEDEEDQGSSRIEGAPEQPPCSPAAKEAGAAFVTFLTSAVGQGSFNFDSAMEKMFQNALILQNEVVSCSIPASVALEVMTQANEFMGAMLNKEDSLLNSVETATEALQSIGFSLSVLACTIEQTLGQKCGVELGGAREELLENVLKLFGACLQRWSFASAEEAGEKSLRKRPKVDRDARFSRMLSSAAAASLQALNKGSQDASNDRHRLSIMKISMDALVCDQVPSVQMEGIKLLKSMFSCNTKHREAILDEIFFLLDDERVGRRSKKPKGIKVPGSGAIHIQPVSAALLVVLQSIPAASTSKSLQDLDHVKKGANYFFHLFERRFAERASLKGRDVKDELKDAESRSFLSDLVEDTLAVLGLPHWGVTEEFLGIILVRFDTLIRKSAQSISPAHKTMIIDIISAAFLGLVKYTQRVQELELKIDLYSSASADELTKLLDMQQADFCSSFAEFSYGESVTAPIKQARSQKDAHYHVFKERARQILVNFLSAQDNFARRGVVCRDAFAYFLARWSAPRQQQRGEEGGDSSDQEGQSFWGAQLKSMSMQQLGPASSLQAQARYISAQQVEIVSMQLTLRSPLLARMPNRLHLLLHHLMNDSKGSDKSRVLRVVKDIAVLKPEILPLGFLRRVGDDLLLDDNANVRASAVDLLSTVCLGKMRNAHDDSDTKETFEALIARKGDVSVKVRQAVFAFLQEVTLIARPRTPLLPFESYAGLVGAHINKHTDGNLVSGRVISFDRKAGTFKLEFGMPDNTSTSENEYQEATFDELKSVLVLKTDESDAILGDASRGFVISHRFVSACCQLCSLILSEEESISKLTQSALHELWFAGQNLPPVNTVLEEIVAVVNSEVLRNNSSWFEGLLSQLPEHAGTRAQQYVDLLFGKLCAIENISPISSPGSGRPSNFNDFDSRARLLLPVLQALKLFAKKMPALVFPHLSKMLPVLSTSEVSKDHLAVLRALQEILCDSVCCHKELSTDNVRCLKRQVEEAESEKQHTSCKNKALDAKLSALRQQLAECTQPSLPLHLESELMKNFTNGAFKLSDTARWQGVEEIAKVTQAFCAVVNCNGTSSSVSLLLKIFKRYMMVLKIFLDQPTDEKATWIPRALIVAGCIVRFFDFASIKNHQDVASHEVDSALSDRESLFTWCAACFANNNREGIKRGALHALGSIFVREPKLMLNATVVKLMKKCLAPDEPQAPQLQVLKNFNDHFLQEEADIVARTAAQSEQGGTVELVSDTSTSLMHQFHSLILESSLSPAPRVREQAVKLVKVILHRGLTASYLCIPYLLAQQCKVDSTALEAIRVLEAIHQREASRFTPDVLWDGIQKAYRMCSAAKELPLDAFAAAFRLLASSDKEKANKAVRLFLEMAIKPFGLLEHTGSNGGTHSCSNTLDFKYFVAKLLAQLPYQSMDSVLMLIKMIQDRASSLGGSCIEGLGRFLGASAEEEDKNLQDAGGLRRWIGEAQCLSLLVQLDKFLQDAYSIKPDRMRKFLADSKTLDKSAIKDATLKERTSLEISIHFATCVPNSLMLSDVARSKLISEYKSLRDLMRGNFVVDAIEDVKLNDQDSAEQPTTKKGKTNTKSVAAAREGKKKDADVVEDDEDEEILDLVVEADELAQREPSARAKNARAASSKKAKKRLYDSDDASGSSDHETQEKVRNTKQGKTVKTKAKGGKKMS